MSVNLREKQISDGRISFYLDIYHNKKRTYEFLGIYLEKGKTETSANREKRRLAEEIKRKREDQLIRSDYDLTNFNLSNADIFEYIRQRSVEKQRTYSTLVTHLKLFAKTDCLPFRVITKEWLLNFQSYLRKPTDKETEKGRLENTVNIYMAALNTLLNEAAQQDIIPYNPWKKVPSQLKAKLTVSKVDPLEPGEIKRMIEKSKGIPVQVVQCFLFSVFTGLRWSDASNLKKSHIRTLRFVDKEGKIIRRKFVVFTQKKTKGENSVPLTVEAIQLLAKRLLDERKELNNKREAGLKVIPSENYFPRLAMRADVKYNTQHGYMWYNLKKWAKQAEIKKRLHYHLTRHTFATLGLEQIGDLSIISSLLGHKKLATTQRYAKVLDRLKVQSIDRLSNYGILNK